MDFRSISSVQSYVKTLDSKYQAEKQQEEGPAVSTDPAKKQSKLDEWIKQRQDEMKSAIETMKRMEESTDHKLADIQSKVYSGTSLSRAEKEYLKTKNPVLYARLEAADLEKKVYERELKRCRTKEEVQRLKLSHTASSLSAVNAGQHSAGASSEQKMALAQGELYKLKGMQDATNRFVRSGAYHSLPTEREKAIAEKRVKQAQERRQREMSQGLLDEIYKNRAPKTGDIKQSAEAADDAWNKQSGAPADAQQARSAEDYLPTEATKGHIDPKVLTDIKPDETVEQAENSREMLKYKRAKARRAYKDSAAAGEMLLRTDPKPE